MIHLVVLAAGRGRRLGTLGVDTPKWLLEVGGATVAERQLEAVDRVTRGSPDLVRSVNIVVGYAAPAIARFAARRPESEFALIDNPAYDELNNWYSLLLALRALDRSNDSRVVVFNADLLAHAEWFAKFLRASASASAEALIAIDTARPPTDEAMKVSVVDGSPHLLERVAKVGVEDPVGEYVGMFMVRGATRDSLRATLEAYVGSQLAADHWYEHAIEQTARNGRPWVVWPTPDSEWIEIDDEADYASAQRMNGI
jgi:choline kinase